MARMTQSEIETYLGEPHIGHLVTVRRDGRPNISPLWFLPEGDRVWIMTRLDTQKVRNVLENPAVAISIATEDRPYKYIVLEGYAEMASDNVDGVIRRICEFYLGPDNGSVFAERLISRATMSILSIRVDGMIDWKDASDVGRYEGKPD